MMTKRCQGIIGWDEDVPTLHCELEVDHEGLHRFGNTSWFDPIIGAVAP